MCRVWRVGWVFPCYCRLPVGLGNVQRLRATHSLPRVQLQSWRRKLARGCTSLPNSAQQRGPELLALPGSTPGLSPCSTCPAGRGGTAALRQVQLGGSGDAACAGHQAAQAHGACGPHRAAGRVGGVHGRRPGWGCTAAAAHMQRRRSAPRSQRPSHACGLCFPGEADGVSRPRSGQASHPASPALARAEQG